MSTMSRTPAFPAHPSGSGRNPGSCRRPVMERADSGLHRDTRRSPLRLREVDAPGRAGTASTGGARRRTAFAWLVLATLLLLAGRPALTGGAWEPVVKGPAAFDRRCIPPDCVVPRSPMPNMLPRHALPGTDAFQSAGALAGLGARRGFTTGSWTEPQDRPESSAAPDALEPPEPPEPGSELRVWLVTAGPGDAVWERYGHNALRVLDTRTGRDVSYNWGFFDFRQADFISRFLQGRMLYMMAPLRTDGMIEQYRQADREVVLQELDLTPAERAMLRDAADENALPRNRDYAYQYFLDNCSTRVRDLLDGVLGGALKQAFDARPTGLSYRDHTRRLTQIDPLIYTGTNLLLGTPTDRPISAWEELFLPLALRDRIRSVRVTRDGETRPLVRAEEVAVSSARSAETGGTAGVARPLSGPGAPSRGAVRGRGNPAGAGLDRLAPGRPRPRRRVVLPRRRGRDHPRPAAGDGPLLHLVEREPLPLPSAGARPRRPAAAVDPERGLAGARPRARRRRGGAGARGPPLAARAGLDPAERDVPRARPAPPSRHRLEPPPTAAGRPRGPDRRRRNHLTARGERPRCIRAAMHPARCLVWRACNGSAASAPRLHQSGSDARPVRPAHPLRRGVLGS